MALKRIKSQSEKLTKLLRLLRGKHFHAISIVCVCVCIDVHFAGSFASLHRFRLSVGI